MRKLILLLALSVFSGAAVAENPFPECTSLNCPPSR